MTREDIDSIISIICPNDEDFEKPIISPAYLKNELEALALEQEPCEDCVSKDAVLDLVADYDLSMGQVVKGIHNLPSVTPQPKMGHWEKDEYGNIHCTFCGCNALYEKIHYPDGYFGKVVRARSGFCPTCGAKMQEVRYGE